MKIPTHIAIIMDGNSRWAKKRHLPKIMGHTAGVQSLKKTVESCLKFGIKYLTVYAFSTENWTRPKREIKGLFKILENFLNKELKLFQEKKVRFRVIGQIDRIDPFIRGKIDDFERATAENDRLVLNIALSYGGRQEILDATKKISEDVQRGYLETSQITEDRFSSYLYTKDCPDPDLLIRTSGEMRISNFLLWQISYAEIHVTAKLWPDFEEKDLALAIQDYQKRERRFGAR